jgi:hypothetical protein
VGIPFIGYTTVFRSRLGGHSLIVNLAGTTPQSREQLERQSKRAISAPLQVHPESHEGQLVLRYLQEKGFLKKSFATAGRYKGYRLESRDGFLTAIDRQGAVPTSLTCSRIDYFLADDCVRSTIGAPTEATATELISSCAQLGLLSQSKSNVTSAGYMATRLLSLGAEESVNPFCLGLELVVYLRSIVQVDSAVILPLLRYISNRTRITRDDVAGQLVDFYREAYEEMKNSGAPVQDRKEARSLVETISKSNSAAIRSSAEDSVRSFGVLEHRTSPRLEWLVDLGALSKAGLPRNVFTYFPTRDLKLLLSAMVQRKNVSRYAEDVALHYFLNSERCSELRTRFKASSLNEGFVKAYLLIGRQVGPTPIADLALLAGMAAAAADAKVEAVIEHLIEWSSREPRISLSGSRYVRTPEMAHFQSSLLEEFRG